MICVIFGGADMEDTASANIPEDAFIIAADRGYDHCVRMGIKPDMIVGDFDSTETKLPCDGRIITAPCEKDDTDLIMAIRAGMDEGCTDFRLYGADGGRMGHTFGSIQTLSFIAERGCTGTLFGRGFVMNVQRKGSRRYTNDGYRYVSLFSLTERAELAVKGLKYGDEFTLTRTYPMGVSNEFTGESCEITIKSGEILAVFEK